MEGSFKKAYFVICLRYLGIYNKKIRSPLNHLQPLPFTEILQEGPLVCLTGWTQS
jgi:hypothetical protein